VGSLFFLAVATAFGQQAEPMPAASMSVATASEMSCSGFISGAPLSKDLYVFEGADNDLHTEYHYWVKGDYVYLRSRTGATPAAGNEFSIVRPAKELMRIRWYEGQGRSLASLGTGYVDVARVKVRTVTPHGAVAEVTFACTPIASGDLAVARPVRTGPQYTPSGRLERFGPSNGKLLGAVTATTDNKVYVGNQGLVHISLGQSDGVAAGQKFRIFHITREVMGGGLTVPPEAPRENIGELVILSTEDRASVAMVVQCAREITLGDGVEQE
jgi:hypothetical protein